MAKTEKPEPGTLVKDPEMKAMVKIVAQMNALDEAQRQRVISWLNSKFMPAFKATPRADTVKRMELPEEPLF